MVRLLKYMENYLLEKVQNWLRLSKFIFQPNQFGSKGIG